MNEMKSLTLDGKTYDSFRDQNAVRVTPQNLTPEQQAQARDNLGSSGIIDVVELPTENIRSDVQYRLMTAAFIVDGDVNVIPANWRCYCVAELPETGEPVSDTVMSAITAYYNVSDNEVYGYISLELGTQAGISEGWYAFKMLIEASGGTFGGIITDIADDPKDSVLRLLISCDYYAYQNGEWTRLIFATEKPPKIDIRFNGDTENIPVVQIDDAMALVKVSDAVPITSDLIGSTIAVTHANGDITQYTVQETDINTNTPGAVAIEMSIVADQHLLVVAVTDPDMFEPAYIFTKGLYFLYLKDDMFTSRLVTDKRIQKIPSKYLDFGSVIGGSF